MAKKSGIDFEKEFENFEEDTSMAENVCEENIESQNSFCDDEGLNNSQGDQNEQQVFEESKESYYLSLAQRVQADFDNYRKRTRLMEGEAYNNGIVKAVLELLPVVDSIDNARKVVSNEQALDAINIIEKQIYMCFDKLNVKRMNSLGAMFDANFHNAVLCGTDPSQEEDVILQVFQEGFTMNDKVLRYAMVQVNKR